MYPFKASATLLCDNLHVTHLSFNLIHHSRMEHIQIDIRFVCDLIQKGKFWSGMFTQMASLQTC